MKTICLYGSHYRYSLLCMVGLLGLYSFHLAAPPEGI